MQSDHGGLGFLGFRVARVARVAEAGFTLSSGAVQLLISKDGRVQAPGHIFNRPVCA